MLARIIRNRDITGDREIEEYLYGSRTDMHDPLLFKDMEKGAEIAKNAVECKERIRIIGDYDADGICSSYILKSSLERLGARVDVRHPDRFRDGYGMNDEMVQAAAADGVSLIITCDNGISCAGSVALAHSLGLKVIITDHHEPPAAIPEADAVIDAKQADCPYPYKELCGASVAFKFIQTLLGRCAIPAGFDADGWMDRMLQFAAIATITDVVPLNGENRIIAREGIRILQNTENPGIKALCSVKGVKPEAISSYHIGFVIGPCLNSAGRLKTAKIAFDLIEAGTQEEADKLAGELATLNSERQELTAEAEKQALEIAGEQIRIKGRPDDIMVIYVPGAGESVVGIVAGRLREKYNHPVFVLTDSEEGIKGSGRSTEHYDMIGELSKHPQLFKKFGGHKMAAGLTLDCSVDEFTDALNQNSPLTESDFDPVIWIDMQLPFKYAGASFAEEIKLLEPFGCENEKPLFAENNIAYSGVRVLGKNSNVLRLNMTGPDGTRINGIRFGDEASTSQLKSELDEAAAEYGKAARISVTYYPQINEYMSRKEINAVIRNIKVAVPDAGTQILHNMHV